MFPNHVKEKQDYITWNDQICNENVKDTINFTAYYSQNFFSKYIYIHKANVVLNVIGEFQ